MVRWTFPQLPSHMSGPMHQARVFLHSCLSITTTGSLFTEQTKCCWSCFLCGGDERRSNMWEMIISPCCGGTGDSVVISPSTSWSLFTWNVGCYTLLKAKESCLGRDKEIRMVLCPAVPLFTEFIQDLKASLNRNIVHSDLPFPRNQQAYCIDI